MSADPELLSPGTSTTSGQPGPPGGPALSSAEQQVLLDRVQRLEVAVATMQDTSQLDARVAAAVTQHVERQLPAMREPSRLSFNGGRKLFPVAAQLLDSLSAPAQDAIPHAQPAGPQSSYSTWRYLGVVWEVVSEVRLIYRMAMDPRYRMTWPARVAMFVVLPAVILSWFLWILVPIFGLIPALILSPLDKIVDILVVLAMYKVLTRELTRYRDLVPDFNVVYGS